MNVVYVVAPAYQMKSVTVLVMWILVVDVARLVLQAVIMNVVQLQRMMNVVYAAVTILVVRTVKVYLMVMQN